MLAERNLQEHFGKKLEELGWEVTEWGKGVKGERESLEEIFLRERLFRAIEKINDIALEEDERNDVLSRLLLMPSSIGGIKNFLDFLKNGIPYTVKREEEEFPKQIYLFDSENMENNNFFAIKEFEVEEDGERRRFDLCLFVNGIPLVGVETKNPFREEEKGTSWYNAYQQILEYERVIPSIFKYIQFCIASDGYETKYFPNHYAKDYADCLSVWKSFYPLDAKRIKPLKIFPYLDSTIFGMLSKRNLLDLIENFIFVKRYRDSYTKIVARWMQFEATNQIVNRILYEKKKKLGLIWHWQGSGKTLTMAFTSWKLLRNVKLGIPTIFIIVDRRGLQRQIVEEEFKPIGIDIETVKSIRGLVRILKWGGKEREGKRGIFICLIQKFKEQKLKKLHDQKQINLQRENIVILTDESHRSQYGVLADVLRGIFHNAFIFGFTGTPLSKPERHTFRKFSPKGELYLDRYGMLDSIQDGFTLPIRYEAKLPELHLKPEEIQELSEYEEETLEELTPKERRRWRKKIRPKLAVLKTSNKIEKVCKDIAGYFTERIERTPLKAMIATVDRECCVKFKRELDGLLRHEYSEIVMTYQAREKSPIKEYKVELAKKFGHSDFDKINRDIIDRFRKEETPRIVIVSDMLLTGFDCRNLWTLFLYKPLKEHRLLQAIARTNRPYQEIKKFGLVVDYMGVAKKLEEALQIFEGDFVKEAKLIIRELKESEKEFEKIVAELTKMIEGVPMKGLEDVDKAVETLILNNKEREFEERAKDLKRLYELLSPCDTTFKHVEFYKLVISISVVLNRYRNIGLRLDLIEKEARKTHELIQKTIGTDKIEKVGEVDIAKELIKLRSTRKPIIAIRVLGGLGRRVRGYKSDFYVSLREEIERIYENMSKSKEVTKDVLQRIERLQERLEQREGQRKKLKDLFPIYDVLKDHFAKADIEGISKKMIEQLKEEDLLNKESFLKRRQRKQTRRIVRENIIKNFGLVANIDEIERSIFVSLEEEYG